MAKAAGRTIPDDDGNIRDLISQILLTKPGERVSRPELGYGLSGLFFAPVKMNFVSLLWHAVRRALNGVPSKIKTSTIRTETAIGLELAWMAGTDPKQSSGL